MDLHCVMRDLSSWHTDSLVVALQFSSCELRAIWDLSSLTRDWTHIPLTVRWSLNRWNIRVVPSSYFYFWWNPTGQLKTSFITRNSHQFSSLQLCPTQCNPIDGSPPGSTVPGILQARALEWVAMSFSSAWKWKVKVKSLSLVQLFATPWTAARQASLSIINSQSLPKLMSIESVMPSNHLVLCHPFSSCPQSFPASGSFQMSQLFALGGQSIGVSASTSVLPMNQDWSPLGWTG